MRRTLSATTNPQSGTAGLATLSGVTYDQDATVYLKASSAGLQSACSSALTLVTQVKESFATATTTTGSSGLVVLTCF